MDHSKVYDVGHEWWWMSIASKLNVVLVVFIKYNVIIFYIRIFVENKCDIVNAFGISQQQLQLWYWMPLKVCMHVRNLFQVFINCVSISHIIIVNS